MYNDRWVSVRAMALNTPRRGSPHVAVAYLRASTSEQRLGPEAQRSAIESWAAREGLTIADWCADLGVSGGAPIDERPGLLAALAALRAHGAGVLVVAKRDRLARDSLAAAMLEQLTAREGARIVSAAGEGTGGDDPSDVLMRRLVDAFAEYERALIRTRTRAALAAKRARGERVGTVPYGWTVSADGRLVESPAEQAAVTQVKALRARGLSLRTIVRRLREMGYTSRAGRSFQLTQVAHMLARDNTNSSSELDRQ